MINHSHSRSAEEQDYFRYNQYGPNTMTAIGPIALIALPGSQAFVEKVDAHLHNRRLEYMSDSANFGLGEPGFLRDSYIIRSESVRFSSGEGKGAIIDSIRGHDTYIFCDVLNYSIMFKLFGKNVRMGPDDHFQDLVRMILATNDKTERVSVIMPFMYEGRQDVRSTRESLDCAYMLKELEELNVKNIVSFDPHDPRVENALPKKSIDNIPVSYQMIKALCREYDDLDFQSGKSTMVISPDEMGIKRAMFFATVLGVPLGTFYRKRDYSLDSKNPTHTFEYLGDSPAGRDVLIIDDMIVTGNAMVETAKKLKEAKAKRVFCISSYLLAVDGTSDLEAAVNAGYIDRVFATNLIYSPPELLAKEWFVSVDLTRFVALLIDALNHNASISSLLDQTVKINRLMQRYDEQQRFMKLNN